MMIVKTTLLKAIQNSEAGGTISEAVTAMIKHTGGDGPSRQASPFMFMGAPKHHTGGIAGLAPDEYPAILKKNNEVLTTSDPRNILNGGRVADKQPTPQNMKIINMIDSGSVVSEGLSSQQRERAIFNFIRANRTGLKQILS